MSAIPITEQHYRAAVGDEKAGYYVPLFLRFDEGGSKASWNWPALFVPFFWLLYRRMYLLAVAYFFGLPIVLGVVGSLLIPALGPQLGVLAYWLIVLACRVAVAMFANAIYHNHVRDKIQSLSRGADSSEAVVQRLIGTQATSGVAIAIAAVAMVFVTGILAAIAIPAYQDYTIRSQVTEGLNLAAPVKASVAQAYMSTNAWPADLADAGLDGEDLSGKYVDSIEISDGTIVILYGKAAHPMIAGHVVTLHPSQSSDSVEWLCGYSAQAVESEVQTDMPARYLPSACRGTSI